MDHLDRSNPTPLYLQLKAVLEGQIASGELSPGVSLPSERQLCDAYGVSRTTVREALRELDHEGLIRTVPGRATFVSLPHSKVVIDVSLTGFTNDVQRRGMGVSSVLLDAAVISNPGPDLVAAMQLEPSDEVIELERLRQVNNAPLALHTVFLNHRFCPQVLHHNLADQSLFNILRQEYGLRIAHAEEQVYAALANQRELELLNLSYPAPVLRSERTTFLDSGEIVEFARASYCGEWYRLSIRLEHLSAG
ncbi:MAG: GntR family transcriptional regulator [Anaerolineae bacterium]|nr:GntR family transcriptional regulator [Anaerolineae bacterium]